MEYLNSFKWHDWGNRQFLCLCIFFLILVVDLDPDNKCIQIFHAILDRHVQIAGPLPTIQLLS